MTDPAYFASAALGIELHKGQREWLENSTKAENVLVTGNRWGKSFVAAVKVLHRVICRLRKLEFDRCGRYHIVTASITQDQANIIFDQVVRIVRGLPWLEALMTTLVRTPYPRMTFGNGAVVEARSTQNRGEYLLGHDYDLFIFDEVAFESDPEYVVEEVIQMRLADREGKLDLVSTPNGRNWFYRRAREVNRGSRNGYFQSGDSRENVYISQDFLKERLTHFSEHRVQQNIMGQFVDSGGEILGITGGTIYDDDKGIALADAYNMAHSRENDEFSPLMTTLGEQGIMGDILRLSGYAMTIVVGVFVFAMSIVLWNAGLMNGIRRYGEIGVRLAMGESKGAIYRAMIIESLCIGLAGSVIGTIAGLAASYYLQIVGFDIGDMMQKSSIMISSVIRAKVSLTSYYIGFFPGVFASVLGTIFAGIGIYRRQTSQLFKELEV